MEEYQNQEEELMYISEASTDEKAEKTLNVFSNIIKYLGYVLGGLCAIFGFGGWVSGEANILAFLAGAAVGALIIFIFLVSASFIKVFVNISLSLKDITKLLNK